MVTNYPQQLAATSEVRRTGVAQTGFVSRFMGLVGQTLCGLRGHDSMLHFEGKRVTMRCVSCGHDTPGWEMNDRAPRLRYEGDARRHRIVKQRLVLRKSA